MHDKGWSVHILVVSLFYHPHKVVSHTERIHIDTNLANCVSLLWSVGKCVEKVTPSIHLVVKPYVSECDLDIRFPKSV